MFSHFFKFFSAFSNPFKSNRSGRIRIYQQQRMEVVSGELPPPLYALSLLDGGTNIHCSTQLSIRISVNTWRTLHLGFVDGRRRFSWTISCALPGGDVDGAWRAFLQGYSLLCFLDPRLNHISRSELGRPESVFTGDAEYNANLTFIFSGQPLRITLPLASQSKIRVFFGGLWTWYRPINFFEAHAQRF